MKRKQTQPKKHFSTLYQLVFVNRAPRLATYVMIVALLTQPIMPVFAAEEPDAIPTTVTDEQVKDSTAEASPTVEEVIEQDEPEETEETPELATVSDSDAMGTTADSMTVEESNEASNDSEAAHVVLQDDSTVVTASSSLDTDPETEEQDVDESATSTNPVENEAPTTTSSTNSGGGGSDGNEAETAEEENNGFTKNSATETGTDASVEDLLSTSTLAYVASNTEEYREETEAHVVYNNEMSFGANECTAVADGSYYCANPVETPNIETDAIFAKSDKDGDTEIFIQKNGELTQLTDNQVDDHAPYYDPVSETIVWHRLINDRYQIVSYNLTDGSEHVLTQSTTNNMEPSRIGELTVWQRWIESNWEIMLFDGSEIIQVTHNSAQDIAPEIRDGHILWQTIETNGERRVSVYEIATGRLSTISDTDGGVIGNPRLVLLYEKTFENGDVVTRGYDFATGEIIPLSATPAEVPDEIPDSDSTGETRALLQPKNEPKTDVEPTDNDDMPTSRAATTTENVGTSTPVTASSTALTLDLSTSTDAATEAMATSSQKEAIPDVVIPPKTASSSAETG